MVKNVRLYMHELVSTSARISQQKPSSFVLFTEFIAFVATMTAMLAIAFLRDLLF